MRKLSDGAVKFCVRKFAAYPMPLLVSFVAFPAKKVYLPQPSLWMCVKCVCVCEREREIEYVCETEPSKQTTTNIAC